MVSLSSRRRPRSLAALLALLPMLPAQHGLLDEQVRHALDAARPAVLAHLRESCEDAVRPGELALVLLAAIHDGVAPDDELMGKALQRLVKAKPAETYDLALRLCVVEASPQLADRLELARDDTKALLLRRDSSGGFHYRPKPVGWDLSNTQYAALGLRAAKGLGVSVDRVVWAKMAKEVGEQQDPNGGFGYSARTERGAGAHASMTAAGITVLSICRQALGDASPQDKAIEKQIERGWQWFERHVGCIGRPEEHWSFYFHYGLERAAILCDVSTVGTVDWYAEGARMLVQAQLPGGGWRSASDGYPGTHLERGRGDSVPTAFAVLFLRRKFQKATGPITPHIVTLAAVGPKAKDADVLACAEELKRRGKAAMPDLLMGLRSEWETQRRAAALALPTIAGESFGYDPARDADGNRDAVRRAELWYLKNR